MSSREQWGTILVLGYATAAVLVGATATICLRTILPTRLAGPLVPICSGLASLAADAAGRRIHHIRLHAHAIPFWVAGLVLIGIGVMAWIAGS